MAVRERSENALCRRLKENCISLANVWDAVQRISIDEHQPGGLDLHPDPMPCFEDMVPGTKLYLVDSDVAG
jgi:hypothetical protein